MVTVRSKFDTASIARAIAGFPVVSCDIFDTAVKRMVARPDEIFLVLGARAQKSGLIRCDAQTFREYRLEAERWARDARDSDHDEVRIAEIYERLHHCGIVSDPAQLAALEFGVERALCKPVEAVRAALATRAPGQKLIFLSDTVYPAAQLSALLRDNGYGDAITVYSSADTRRSKHTGRLYRHVLDQLGLAPSSVVHLGDNPVTDVTRAREHGITAVHLPWNWPPPQTSTVAARDWPVQLLHSYRRSRVMHDAAVEFSDVGPSLYRALTILLVGFTLFVLSEARSRGIRRIFFLGRDGYLPHAIAKRLVARSGEAMDLSYLYVSRQAIVVPTQRDDLDTLARDIAANMEGRPLNTTLEFIGIGPAEASPLLRDRGFDPEQILRSGAATMQSVFKTHRDVVLGKLEERAALACAYLEQEGFLAAGPRIVVDAGWRGSTQSALAKLTGIPENEIAGCYLGLLPGGLRPGLNPRTASGYLFSFGSPKRLMDVVLDGYGLIELLFSAPYGSTLSYKKDNGRIVPVLAEETGNGADLRREVFAAVEEGCLKEFDALDAMLDGAWPNQIDPASALHDLEQLLVRPTKKDVHAINRIPFIGGINGARNQNLVTAVSWRELVRDPKRALRRIETSPWRSGAVRASLPWLIPDMSYADFRYRAERLMRTVMRT